VRYARFNEFRRSFPWLKNTVEEVTDGGWGRADEVLTLAKIHGKQ
jgi:hypothetical protein